MKQVKWWLLAIILLLLDQLLKWWLLKTGNLLGFHLEVIKNNKFVLGYGPSIDLFFWVVIFIVLVMAIFLMKNPKQQKIAILIMLSGALSNLIDRFTKGGVIDYFNLKLGNGLYFNLADIYLLTALIYYLYLAGKENEKQTGNKIFRHQ